jgi:hypothetical protein
VVSVSLKFGNFGSEVPKPSSSAASEQRPHTILRVNLVQVEHR